MRLFVAIPIPAPARQEIAGLLARLRATHAPVRWVSDENAHLTLKFFGEVAPERLDVIGEAVRYATRDTLPIPLHLTEPGAFPSMRHPRVLWVGVDPAPALELLQDRLERQGEAIGFPPEGAPFRPHVTLGRVREGHKLPRTLFDAEATPVNPAAFVADRVVLYESVLGAGGPSYRPRLTLHLDAPAPRPATA